jgi:hypothetical protein
VSIRSSSSSVDGVVCCTLITGDGNEVLTADVPLVADTNVP